jgi:hypothetical protein
LLTYLASAKPFDSWSWFDDSSVRSLNVGDEYFLSACWDLLDRTAARPIDSAKPMKQLALPLAVSPAPV